MSVFLGGAGMRLRGFPNFLAGGDGGTSGSVAPPLDPMDSSRSSLLDTSTKTHSSCCTRLRSASSLHKDATVQQVKSVPKKESKTKFGKRNPMDMGSWLKKMGVSKKQRKE